MEQSLSTSQLSAERTNPSHFSFASTTSSAALFVTEPNETEMKSDNNNVDLDKEVVNMTDNSLYYNTLATIANKKFRILKSAISERIS